MENGQAFENSHHVILKYNLIIHLGCQGIFSLRLSHSNEGTEHNHLFYPSIQLFN